LSTRAALTFVSTSKEPANPFYLLLAIVGVFFVITACGYAVMVFRAGRMGVAAGPPHPLVQFLDLYGGYLLAGELVILGGATVAAIGLDDWRIKRRGR